MSSSLEVTKKFIDSHFEEYIENLFQLLRIQTTADNLEGQEKCLAFLKNELSIMGFATEILRSSDSPEEAPVLFTQSQCAGRPLSDKESVLLLYGHYDVQSPGLMSAWESPPFEPTIRNGRIYARGAGDNKGQLVAQLAAIKATMLTTNDLPIQVKMLIDSEEERGSPHLASLVQRYHDLFDCDVACCVDGAIHPSGRPLLIFGARGILYLEVEATGPPTDLHSGYFGGVVRNPAIELCQMLTALIDSDGNITLEGFYDHVRTPSEREMDLLDRIPYDETTINFLGDSRIDVKSGQEFYKRLMFCPTLNVCGINSTSFERGARTIIPSTAWAKIETRLVPNQNPEEILGLFEKFIRNRFPDMKIFPLAMVPPSYTSVDHKVAEYAYRSLEAGWNMEPIIYPSLPATLPSYVFTDILRKPTIVLPCANPDQNNHAPNENLSIDCFRKGIYTIAALLQELVHYNKS